MDTAAELEHEVRELVRRRGIDPVRDRARLRELVREALDDYDDRALRGHAPPLVDRPGTGKALEDALGGFGPLQPYLDDPTVEEVWINAPDQVFVARGGEAELTATILDPSQVRDLVEQHAQGLRPAPGPVQPVRRRRAARRRAPARRHPRRHPHPLGRQHPQVPGARLPPGRPRRARLADPRRRTLPGRRRRRRAQRPGLRADPGRQDHHAERVGGLDPAPRARDLLRGGLRAADRPPRHRRRCRPASRAWRAPARSPCAAWSRRRCGCARAASSSARCARRSRLDMLIALNAGVPGMCTVHANSAREALTKICTLPLLAGENVTAAFVVPTVAAAVDLVVHLEVDGRGRRRTAEIVAVPGRVEQRRGRDRRPLPPARGPAGARAGVPARTPSGSRGSGSTWRRCSRTWTPDVGVVAGLLLGAGLVPGDVVDDLRPTRPGVAARAGGSRPSAELLVQAGAPQVTPGAAARHVRRLPRARPVAWSPPRSPARPAIATCFALIAGYAPLALVRARATPPARGAARAVARRGRPPRLGDPSRPLAARGAGTARRARPRGAARAVRRVRRGLPRHRPVRRVPRRAQGAARRPGGGPHRRGAAPDPRRRRHRPRPPAAHARRLPACRRAHPRRAGGPPELDRERRAPGRRRTVGGARAARHPPRGDRGVQHADRRRGAGRRGR